MFDVYLKNGDEETKIFEGVGYALGAAKLRRELMKNPEFTEIIFRKTNNEETPA